MNFSEVNKNNRVDIEYEVNNPFSRIYKGIVLKVENESIYLVTEYGELVELLKDKILSIERISFDKRVAVVLSEAKNYYDEVLATEEKLKNLKSLSEDYKQKLFDANFLSKFNIEGANNRLKHSIPNDLFSFKRDENSYKLYIKNNPDNQIILNIKVFKTFEYYNLDEIGNVDKIIKIHAPDSMELFEKAFSFSVKIDDVEKSVVHEKNNIYSVSTLYKIYIDVSADNFLQVRTNIINALNNIRR